MVLLFFILENEIPKKKYNKRKDNNYERNKNLNSNSKPIFIGFIKFYGKFNSQSSLESMREISRSRSAIRSRASRYFEKISSYYKKKHSTGYSRYHRDIDEDN